MPLSVIAGATVLAVEALNNNVPELAIVVPETASEKVAVLPAALVIVVAATVELNVVLSLRVIDKSCVPPIALANVGVPVTIIAPFPEALPLIAPVIVLLAPENVAVAVAVVLSVKVIVVTVTVSANVACEFSALEAISPPKIPILVPVTVPLNNAEPAFVVDPIVIVVAATLPENVISEILLSELLMT